MDLWLQFVAMYVHLVLRSAHLVFELVSPEWREYKFRLVSASELELYEYWIWLSYSSSFTWANKEPYSLTTICSH